MKKRLGRVRSAVLMGLAWAVVWAPVGVLIGLIVDPDGSMDEMWVAVGAYPGFLCGAIVAAVLGNAQGLRGIAALPLARVGVRGALSGVSVGLLPSVVATTGSEPRRWLLGILITVTVTFLSAVSAVGSVLLVRAAERRAMRGAGTQREGPESFRDSSLRRNARARRHISSTARILSTIGRLRK